MMTLEWDVIRVVWLGWGGCRAHMGLVLRVIWVRQWRWIGRREDVLIVDASLEYDLGHDVLYSIASIEWVFSPRVLQGFPCTQGRGRR